MTPVTEALLAHLDLDKVQEKVRAIKLDEPLYDFVGDLTVTACDKYLADDLTLYDVAKPELRWDLDGLHGTFDLVLWGGRGRPKIIDWKTTTGSFYPNYEQEHIHSWQTYMYLGQGRRWLRENYGVDIDSMAYRAVARERGGGTIEVPASATDYERLVNQQHVALATSYWSMRDLSSWPKSLPFPCHKGSKEGATCPYWEDCTSGGTPLVQISDEQMQAAFPIRKSHFSKFQECNERYRRDVVLSERREGNIAMAVGSAFGLAVEEIWNQAFELKGKR